MTNQTTFKARKINGKYITEAGRLTPTMVSAYLDYCEFVKEHGRSPTIREFGEVRGVVKSAAYSLVASLVRAGLLESIGRNKSRNYVITGSKVDLPTSYHVLKELQEVNNE